MLAGLNDFFRDSECRDLLFQSQEHCMNLTEIEKFLNDNGL